MFPESGQKKLAKRCGLNGVRAKKPMISFATLLSLAKKRFTRVNKDNDKHKRGTHKCPYIEELHDMKTLYK